MVLASPGVESPLGECGTPARLSCATFSAALFSYIRRCTQVLRFPAAQALPPLLSAAALCSAPLLSRRCSAAHGCMLFCIRVGCSFLWRRRCPLFWMTAAPLHCCMPSSCPVYALLGSGLFHYNLVRVLLRSCVLRPSLCDALLRSGLLRSCPLVAAAVLRIAPRRGAQHPPLGSANKEAGSLQRLLGCICKNSILCGVLWHVCKKKTDVVEAATGKSFSHCACPQMPQGDQGHHSALVDMQRRQLIVGLQTNVISKEWHREAVPLQAR